MCMCMCVLVGHYQPKPYSHDKATHDVGNGRILAPRSYRRRDLAQYYCAATDGTYRLGIHFVPLVSTSRIRYRPKGPHR